MGVESNREDCGHGAEHEAVLVAVLCGERAATDPEVLRLCASCTACASEFDAFARLQARLEREAGAEARALAAAADTRVGGAPLPGAGEVDAFLRARLAERSASGARGTAAEGALGGRVLRGPAWRTWAIAASLLAIGGVGWLLWSRDSSSQPGSGPDVSLGLRPVRLLAPLGEVERYDVFEWEGRLEVGDCFEFSIHAVDATADARPLYGPVRIVAANRYTLPAVGLPDAIRWKIEQFDSSHDSIGSASALVRRSVH
jgi:hypothetical protein